MFNDLWNSSAFNLVEMTNAINLMPRVGDDISDIISFKEDKVLGNEVAIDVTTEGDIELIPSSPLGAEGAIMNDWENAFTRKFEIPYYVERGSLMNHEVVGARVPGTQSLRILETERNKRLAFMKKKFDATRAHQRWTALTGKVVDCNGRLLMDTVAEFKMKRQKLKLRLSDKENDINDQLVDMKEKIEDILGFVPKGYKLITTTVGNQLLRKNEVYKEQNTNPLAQIINRQDKRDGTVFATNVEVKYFRPHKTSGEANFLVPEIPDLCRTINGPSLSSKFWGQVLPFYVTPKIMDHDEGIEFKGAMRTLSYLTRPDAVIDVEFVA